MPDVFPRPGSRLDRIRKYMDAVDALIDRAVSEHDAEIEDVMLVCKRDLLHAQANERRRESGEQR